VMVKSAGELNKAPSIDALLHTKLLYMGQAGGSAVFYDSANGSSIYLPSSSIVMKVANCDAEDAPDPLCSQ
jgi:hypothetical protein